ncbi:two-component system sensor histidine kinase DraK [soil metagenome]
MRERLTAAFVAITLLLLVGAGLVRSYSIQGQLRAHEGEFVTAEARAIGAVVADKRSETEPVEEPLLRTFVTSGMQVVYQRSGSATIVVTGDNFRADDEVVSSTVFVGRDQITVSRLSTSDIDTLWGGDPRASLGLLGLLGLLAGVIGYVVARAMSAPFRQLAKAAEALGRGRFDLDLPDSRVPEARAMARALDSSASQLRDRLEREREFGLLTSHVLRTPLTSLRFRLEELVGDPTLSADAREAALGCLKAVGQINEVAGELVEISGRGVLVAGAAVPLRDLATQVSQRWSDTLSEEDRALTAAVEGDIELLFTPGPVEQVLDVLLDAVIRGRTGSVRLVFECTGSRLRVDLTCVAADGSAVAMDRVPERAVAVVTALGGRVEQSAGDSLVRVHLPRR